MAQECNPEIDEASGKWLCKSCGFSHPQHFKKNCAPPLRPRTKEEIKAIYAICKTCQHYIDQPNELTVDGMVCALKAKGCGACRAWEEFYAYIQRGNGCADKSNARFPATEFVESERH